MLFYLLKTIILSLILILIVHNLYIYFINTLTVPKVKDLIDTPNKKYEEIFKKLNDNIEKTSERKNKTKNINENIIKKNNASSNMKNELLNFLNSKN
tara:strand:+ start:354 stop:644 length:291 start_codon:yes stop_codon:yes gene_type:complete